MNHSEEPQPQQIEIWIPSKDRIAERLIGDLKISLLQSGPSKEAGFMIWLKSNHAALQYIGERYVSYIVGEVTSQLNLRASKDGYYKREE